MSHIENCRNCKRFPATEDGIFCHWCSIEEDGGFSARDELTPKGYHARTIAKGVMGEWSKVVEEFEETKDALDQGNNVMVLVELADMIGAIEAFVETRYNHTVTLDDLLKMKDATKRAFESGERK